MPVTITNTISGAIKLIGLPERACFTNWQDFITALPQFLGVELPAGASGVLIGHESPSEDDRDKIWFRRDPGGSFLGTYAFQKGSWRPLYSFAPNQIITMWGDSNSIPEGFVLIEEGDTAIPTTIVKSITGTYIPAPAPGTGFIYFAVRYVGF